MLPSQRTIRLLDKGRSAYSRLFPGKSRFGFTYDLAQLRGQEGCDRIRQELLAPKPSMICRFGSTELLSLLGHLGHLADPKPSLLNHIRYITGALPDMGTTPSTRNSSTCSAACSRPGPTWSSASANG